MILQQGNTIFKADKAVKNDSLNVFEAWGHVHINDADTTNIYADHLKYFGEPQLAKLDGNVKLSDGQATLTAPSLDYDMSTNMGIYKEGGKVVNQKTVITSKEGEYYSDIKDVYFKKNVVVNDPAYHITTDSLQYNTTSQVATFITMTHIKDSSNRSIDTKEGYYNLKTKQAEFGQRPFINDNNKSTLVADNVYLDDNIATAEGNAIAVDSVRGTIIIGGRIFQNRLNEAILATQKPVMIIKQDNDSIYVAADTLFSAKLSDLFEQVPVTSDTLANLNESDETIPPIEKALVQDSMSAEVKNQLAQNDTVPNITEKDILQNDSSIDRVKKEVLENDSTFDIAQKNVVKNDSIINLVNKNKSKIEDVVEQTQNNLPNKDSAVSIVKKDARMIAQDTIKINTKSTSDSTDRYFEAFHNVRIYSDSMQAVSDSLFYSFKDSTFRLYKDPVVWGKESQITGDTILLHTKNKQPHWMEAFKNGFMVNYVGNEAYNQIKSTRIDAYFIDGGLDSVRAKGSAESIYYLQDDDSAFTGINQSTSDIIDSYFENKQLHKVAFRNNVEGTIYPIKQKSPSEMKLEGFIWREGVRPKSKYELFQ
ncbi:OstA-like protein [Niabella ginsengisoli]|uniref:LPS export ABC transporter periplasmic protein LptC n=1 Tax=Niabella ginsengisoli TaxID=522298 RepID=A0ABS9SH65_9BACT|nr:LPS export ABC transporter periplasmic protein LptC [Niabella ginsengisoli]